MSKITILGANGQLGSDLLKTFVGEEVQALTHTDLEICNFEQTREILTGIGPEIVINTTAFHRVDDCEDQPQKAFEVNGLAVRNLAQICRQLGCTLVHMSSDYVFGGGRTTPFTEADLPNPINVYGVSKLAGEHFVRYECGHHFIVRSSGLFGVAGSSGKGGNFIELMIRLAKEGKHIRVVNDQVLTPTYTADLAEKIFELVKTEAYGLYHITNSEPCAWFEFAQAIFDQLNLHPSLEPVTTATFAARATRPAYSALAHVNLLGAGLGEMRPWREALKDYLRKKGHLN